jgi:MFS transporter, DHA1 family, multidrug resistance protein
MAEQTASSIAADSRSEISSTLGQVVVLAALASSGTLGTNILLPSLPGIAASLQVSSAAVTSAITVFLAVMALGQLVVGPISDRFGRRWPVLAGFVILLIGSIWCALATDLPSLLIGRVIQGVGACATSVLTRAIARDLFSGAALARALALIMIAMAVAPGFSPLLGGALDHYFGWRAEFVFIAVFAVVSLLAYELVFGETHHSVRTPLNLRAVAGAYLGLSADRRFLIPAATLSLIMGELFAVFAATPRVLIEGLHFSPIQLGLFFAGTVMIVFAAGMLATQLGRRLGLDRAIQGGLLTVTASSIALLLVASLTPTFFPFLATLSLFLLGMGIVIPLATAQALSPFADRAGVASALLGFGQSVGAAITVSLVAIVSHEPMFALGIVMTAASLFSLALQPIRAKS